MPEQYVFHITYCYHEAGHAVAYWHHGIEIEYVTMNPSDPGHWGETRTVPHDVTGLGQIEAEMQCAVAGEVAEYTLCPPRQELTDDFLIRCFKRDADKAADPDVPASDGLNFARMGLARDNEVSRTASGIAIGPANWLPVFRQAERLIRVELWPAVQAVADELSRSNASLYHSDVATLAAKALNRIAQLALSRLEVRSIL